MSKLTDFIGQLTSGIARTNRYSVEITLPQLVGQNIHISNVYKMQLLCDSVAIPSLNVNTVQIRTFGEVREMPTEFNYDPIQLSFYVDGDMQIKHIFDTWIKSVQNGSRRTFNYYNEYICPQMFIYVEDLQDNKVYKVAVYEAWPKTVNAVTMSYEQKDVMKLTVSMMFKWWETALVGDDLMAAPDPVVNAPRANDTLPEVQTVQTTITNYTPDTYVDPMGNIAYSF